MKSIGIGSQGRRIVRLVIVKIELETNGQTCRKEATVIKRFTLYGSPHSLPTYKVALMLRLAGEPFSFRYVSFQKGMHKTPEFLALSR